MQKLTLVSASYVHGEEDAPPNAAKAPKTPYQPLMFFEEIIGLGGCRGNPYLVAISSPAVHDRMRSYLRVHPHMGRVRNGCVRVVSQPSDAFWYAHRERVSQFGRADTMASWTVSLSCFIRAMNSRRGVGDPIRSSL
jgi:hypothetical protein